jgi:hypothetical protein
MEISHPMELNPFNDRNPRPLRPLFAESIRYWEPRRIIYNAALSAVSAAWVAVSWPHFRPAITWSSVLPLAVLALLANACYCAAYLVDIPLQLSSLGAAWRRWRWTLWLLGTLFAILLASYWINDEIYPAIR